MTSKRELIEPHKGDKRYVRRNPQGEFKESDDVGPSLAADRRNTEAAPEHLLLAKAPIRAFVASLGSNRTSTMREP